MLIRSRHKSEAVHSRHEFFSHVKRGYLASRTSEAKLSKKWKSIALHRRIEMKSFIDQPKLAQFAHGPVELSQANRADLITETRHILISSHNPYPAKLKIGNPPAVTCETILGGNCNQNKDWRDAEFWIAKRNI